MKAPVVDQGLLELVATKLAHAATTTDASLIACLNATALCRHVLNGTDADEVGVRALRAFVDREPNVSTLQVIDSALAALEKDERLCAQSLAEQQVEILRELEKEAGHPDIIERAIARISLAREYFSHLRPILVAGPRHRFELLVSLLSGSDQPAANRRLAGATLLRLSASVDHLPAAARLIKVINDDRLIALALNAVPEIARGYTLHWVERISSLWRELPFLRGIQLSHRKERIEMTWLDRVNSYVSFEHILDREAEILILVQPSIAFVPLNPIISLLGLLVLDGMTASQSIVSGLQIGRHYEVDGAYRCIYGGLTDLVPGWLSLTFRDGTIYCPPFIARRLAPTAPARLSPGGQFSAVVKPNAEEPLQRFFDWSEAIGLGTITGKVLFVSSRQQAAELFGDVSSNGVPLINTGLIAFAGLAVEAAESHGAPIIVVPTLTVARQIAERGDNIHAIVVDGYERLRRGRHDLPFIRSLQSPPSIVVWTQKGYFPQEASGWLGKYRLLALTPADVTAILEVEEAVSENAAPQLRSLAFTSHPNFESRRISSTDTEVAVIAAIREFQGKISESSEFPDYWKYHLLSVSVTLRSVVEATPAYWDDIKAAFQKWSTAFAEEWTKLSRHAVEALAPIHAAQRALIATVERVSDVRNSKADALASFFEHVPDENWKLVSDLPEQLKIGARFIRRAGVANLHPVLLRDLAVCENCIVVGWTSTSFARRLFSHTPVKTLLFADKRGGDRWAWAIGSNEEVTGDSLLASVMNMRGSEGLVGVARPPVVQNAHETEGAASLSVLDDEHTPREACVFLWLSGEPLAKVLGRMSRVLVESGDNVADKRACDLMAGERVILGTGSSRWSPAEEFTQAVVDAVEASHPDLVHDAKEWRRALRKLLDAKSGSIFSVKQALDEVGVKREVATLDGWLRLDRAAPITPQHGASDLRAIWKVIGPYATVPAEQAITAGTRLRSLRSAAGRALIKQWKGENIDLGVDARWLGELVADLQTQVQVHEVETVSPGVVPAAVIGWWIADETAARFEVGAQTRPDDSEAGVCPEED